MRHGYHVPRDQALYGRATSCTRYGVCARVPPPPSQSCTATHLVARYDIELGRQLSTRRTSANVAGMRGVQMGPGATAFTRMPASVDKGKLVMTSCRCVCGGGGGGGCWDKGVSSHEQRAINSGQWTVSEGLRLCVGMEHRLLILVCVHVSAPPPHQHTHAHAHAHTHTHAHPWWPAAAPARA